MLGRLKQLFPAVRRHEEVITAALDLAVFMLIVPDRLCHPARDEPRYRALPGRPLLHRDDALDDRLRRRHAGRRTGRLLSMGIMIVGISLFFRLAQAVFRPGGKVRHPCPHCGLRAARWDAVHCKACGLLLNIPNDED